MKKITSKTLLPVANAYIIISIAYYWLETYSILNPIAIGLALIFELHLFIAKKNSKLIFPVVFIAINLYMFFALFSELCEFNSFNKDAFIMLLVGGLYLGFNILSGLVIIFGNIQSSSQIMNSNDNLGETSL